VFVVVGRPKYSVRPVNKRGSTGHLAALSSTPFSNILFCRTRLRRSLRPGRAFEPETAIRARLREAVGSSESRKSHELENLLPADLWTNSRPSRRRVDAGNSTSVNIRVADGLDQREGAGD
jgi:hypothetical protein